MTGPDDPAGVERRELLEFHAAGDPGGNGAEGESRVSPLERLRASLLSTEAVESLEPPDPLIQSYLYQNSLAMLYGPSGAGKTFLALDLACHVATGSWWNGQRTNSGPVLYVIAEGASGVGRRLAAWRQHHRVPDLGDRFDPILWLPRAVDLFSLDQAAVFAALAGELAPVLIIVDTLHRCILGAEENSARDMGRVLFHLDMVRRETGACILLLHHSGKDTSLGSRGSSALRAAMDTELELTDAEGRGKLRVTKQKDGAEERPLFLTRLPAADSLVLIPSDRIAPSDEITQGELDTLETLRRVQVPGGVPTSVWQEASECSRSTFYRHRAHLLAVGLAQNLGTDHMPRYHATEETTDP